MTAGTAPDLLATIVAAAARMTDVRRSDVPDAELERAASARRPNGAAFVAALRDGPAPRVIAECKRRSPSRGILRERYDPADHAASYASATRSLLTS